jgi:uncharacterized RDD family membrane protein YckC
MRWRDIKQGRKQAREEQQKPVSYAPFLPRLLGFITDLFMIGLPVSLLIMMIFGYDQVDSAGAMDVILQTEKATTHAPDPTGSIVQVLLSLAIYVAFWHNSGQTPGKKMARIRVVDAKTLGQASWLKLTVRFVGYFLSALTLVGFFIGLLRRDKRALHDLISGTAVVREAPAAR